MGANIEQTITDHHQIVNKITDRQLTIITITIIIDRHQNFPLWEITRVFHVIDSLYHSLFSVAINIPYSCNSPCRNRPSWREERALNSETFGAPSVAAARRFHHGRHGRGGWRGGGFRRGGGGGGGGGGQGN